MNLARILDYKFPEIRARYGIRETILYALGVGACSDPLNEDELSFVYEANLQSLPSMCCVLAHPGFWAKNPEFEIDWVKLVHAEQRFTLVAPLPAQGEVIGQYKISGVVDKGHGKGTLLHFDKVLLNGDGTLLGSVVSTLFLRGDGGCGSWGEPALELTVVPATAPTGRIDVETSTLSALTYRLSGDYNPLHADPAVARDAGFPRPILHGLCTFGVACQALIRELCGFDAKRLRTLGARFTKPVYPGETLRTEYWLQDRGEVQFRCSVVERGEVVLDRGVALIDI